MNRRKFISMVSAGTLVVAGTAYWVSDRRNYIRPDEMSEPRVFAFQPDEREILYLASLAPSGHNTQPWFVKYIEPYHWIVCNDKTKWLPGVDPTQRETILSLGAFLQNLEYASFSRGYEVRYTILASTNQSEEIAEIHLRRSFRKGSFDTEEIQLRRTVRSNYLNDALKRVDIDDLTKNEKDFFHFIPNSAKEYTLLTDQTVEANRIQSYRDTAQQELANWIRFSSAEAKEYRDGLTTASMEIEGVPGWVLRNFYHKKDVLKKDFREKSIDKVVQQVKNSGGWLLILSKDDTVPSLVETGKRLQRLLLKIRKKNIVIHPMTQVLEEPSITSTVNRLIGINNPIQFVLRTGYISSYPKPVSLRRPVDWFVRTI